MDKEIELKVQDQAYFEAALMVAKLTEENELLREACQHYNNKMNEWDVKNYKLEKEIEQLKEEVERSYHKGRSEGEEFGYQMGYDEGYKEGLREERE